jgi:hypothetical protein
MADRNDPLNLDYTVAAELGKIAAEKANRRIKELLTSKNYGDLIIGSGTNTISQPLAEQKHDKQKGTETVPVFDVSITVKSTKPQADGSLLPVEKSLVYKNGIIANNALAAIAIAARGIAPDVGDEVLASGIVVARQMADK